MTDAVGAGHPRKAGTWIRSNVAVSDSGDFNDRNAPAGAVGIIDAISEKGGAPSYTVVFWPSLIRNYWDSASIDADATILAPADEAIPSAMAYGLCSAVADMLVEGDVDADTGLVTAPSEVVARIVAASGAAGAHEAAVRKLMMAGLGEGEISLSFGEFDDLAEMTGIGDRLKGHGVLPAMRPR